MTGPARNGDFFSLLTSLFPRGEAIECLRGNNSCCFPWGQSLSRVVSRFLSSRFHPKSRRLFQGSWQLNGKS